MKPTKKLILSIACLGAGLALAQDGERRPPGGPGGPDGGNASSRLGEFLKNADTNGDGKVNKEEYIAYARKEAEERFGKMDANTDGQVDQAEIAEAGQRLREIMGNRGNGSDSQGPGGFRRGGADNGGGFRRPPGGEGAADGPTPPPSAPPGGPEGGPRGDRGPGGRGPGGPGGPGGGAGGPGMGNPDELFSKMDKNADGSVDLAEYSEPQKAEIEARFKRADSNGDGKLSKDEMIAAIRASMQMRQGQGQGGPGMRRGPGGAGGPGGPGGDGGFRRPPGNGGEGSRPRPEGEGDAPKPPTGV